MQILQQKMSVHAHPSLTLFIAIHGVQFRDGKAVSGLIFAGRHGLASLVAWREWCFAIRESFVGFGVNQNALPARL